MGFISISLNRARAAGHLVPRLSEPRGTHTASAFRAVGGWFHAVAVIMRGYGQSDRPEAIDQYTLLHLVGDMVGLLDALGVQQAVIAGHDWGAVVAWHATC